MKKFAGILLTLILSFIITPSISAQASKDKSLEKPGMTKSWRCIKIPTDPVTGKSLSCTPKTCSNEGVNGHRVKLDISQIGLKLEFPIYIIECVSNKTGDPTCTTGNVASDMEVYGQNNLAVLKGAADDAAPPRPYNYEFQGLFDKTGKAPQVKNPFSVPQGKTLPSWYEWQDETRPATPFRKWLTLQYIEPPPPIPVGGEGGNQQGTFGFDNQFNDKSCASIQWDPYGRVFDAKTLEPIPGIQVTLLMKKANGFSPMTTGDLLGGALINPQTTSTDGIFNFVVPDGDYKLTTVPDALLTTETLDPNYSKAYFDIYGGEVIQQRGAIQHRDIAVATRNTNNPPKILSFFYDTYANGMTVLDGAVTHPLSILNVKTAKISASDPKTKVPYRIIETAEADKFGIFKIKVDGSKLEQTAAYVEVVSEIEAVKVDLRTMQPTSQTDSKKLEPIPSFLNGYAYDTLGKPLANATVGVYLNNTTVAYSDTTTDETGLFKLSSEYLPTNQYELRYTTATGVVVKTKPSVFLGQNIAYFASAKVNPYVGQNINGKLMPTGPQAENSSKSTKKGNITVGNTDNGPGKTAVTGTTATSQDNKMMGQIVTLIAIILLLVVGVIGIALFLKKKQQPPTGLPPIA